MKKLILGTVQFGLDYGIGRKATKLSREEIFLVLETAIENGLEFLETAFTYGDSEEIIGEFINESGTNFKIISKPPLCKKEDVEGAFETTLKRLKVNSLYGYLIHDFDHFIENPGLWGEIISIKKKGYIKKIGFSLYHPHELKYLLDKDFEIDIIQIPYSIFDQRFSEYFYDLKKRKVEIHARSVFLRGLVFMEINDLSKKFSKIKPKLEALNCLSLKSGIPVSALCLNFALLNENIDKVIIGVDSIDNLKENMRNIIYVENVKNVYNNLSKFREEDSNIVSTKTWTKSLLHK